VSPLNEIDDDDDDECTGLHVKYLTREALMMEGGDTEWADNGKRGYRKDGREVEPTTSRRGINLV